MIVGEIVEFYIGVILVLRFVLYSISLSKLEYFVRFKVKLFWVYDNFLWFLFFFNIIKYECRYSCMDFWDFVFNEIVRDMVYSNCFEWDINFIGVICFIFFVCGEMCSICSNED